MMPFWDEYEFMDFAVDAAVEYAQQVKDNGVADLSNKRFLSKQTGKYVSFYDNMVYEWEDAESGKVKSITNYNNPFTDKRYRITVNGEKSETEDFDTLEEARTWAQGKEDVTVWDTKNREYRGIDKTLEERLAEEHDLWLEGMEYYKKWRADRDRYNLNRRNKRAFIKAQNKLKQQFWQDQIDKAKAENKAKEKYIRDLMKGFEKLFKEPRKPRAKGYKVTKSEKQKKKEEARKKQKEAERQARLALKAQKREARQAKRRGKKYTFKIGKGASKAQGLYENQEKYRDSEAPKPKFRKKSKKNRRRRR